MLRLRMRCCQRLRAARPRLRRRSSVLFDLVVFDPATVADHATYDRPQQYAPGVGDVFVNGVQVLRGGEHTGATPGRVVRGPGWAGRAE